MPDPRSYPAAPPRAPARGYAMRKYPTVVFSHEFIQNARQEAMRTGRRRTIACNDRDFALRGFMLIVEASGAVRFVLRYLDPKTNRQRMLKLGAWPGLSDAEARRRVMAARAKINRGLDPRTGAAEPNRQAGGDT